MYPITSAVKALFDSEQRQVLRITGASPRKNKTISIYSGNSKVFESNAGQSISVYSGDTEIYNNTGADEIDVYSGDKIVYYYDKDGKYSLTITDADVMMSGFSIDRYCCNGQKLEVGTAIAAEMTLRLDNRDGRFNDVIFEGTELFVEIGIADWSQEEPEIHYMPCGYFTPDEQPRSLSTITIHALDRMMLFDVMQPTLVPWTDGNGNEMTDGNGETIYFFSDIAFPKTVAELVAEICDRCGVPFTQDLSDLPNYDYSISNLPNLQQEISLRNLIQWCAGLMGCNAWIDWDGELRFSWFGEATGYTSAKSNRIFSDLHEDDVTITGVQYTNTEGVTIISGSADYAIDMTGNYLVGNGVAQVLSAINSAINGYTYRPFNATVLTAPYLWPMDSITFTDKDGNDQTCVLTNVNFGINRNMELEGRGESAQTNKGINPSGVTNEQAFLVEKVVKSLEDFDSSLSQEEVFRRLTNNGETQGIYMQDGKIYINGTYIQAGTIIANLIKGGVLTLGGADNENGLLQVLNANGDVVVTLDDSGANISEGSLVTYSADKKQRMSLATGALSFEGFLPSDASTVEEWRPFLRIRANNAGQTIEDSVTTFYTGGSMSFSPGNGQYFQVIAVAPNFALYSLMVDEFGVSVTGPLNVYSGGTRYAGASGSFTTADGKTVTVRNGIITSIQ